MPRFAASGLGLHCLPMSQKWDARPIWFKPVYALGTQTSHLLLQYNQLLTFRFDFA